MAAQQRPPVGTGPGPSAAHRLIQPGGLEGQDRFGILACCAQLLLSRISVETALGYARFGQGLEGLPGGIGQHDPELGSEPPGELALPVAQAQQAVRIEATGGNGPIRELLSAPAAPLRDLLDQADSGLLNGAHLVPAGSGLQQGESIGMPVGRQGCQKSCELGAVPALGTLRLTHVGGDRIRQLRAVHAHGQSQQSLVGNGGAHEQPPVVAQGASNVLLQRNRGLLARTLHKPLRLLRSGEVALAGVVLLASRGLGAGAALVLAEASRVLRDPGLQDVRAQCRGVGRLEPVQVELP